VVFLDLDAHSLKIRVKEIRRKMNSIKLTKLECARRQMETAILLWFDDGEPVSIHTLAAASLEVLHDLGKRIGESALIFDSKRFRKEKFSEWKKIVRESQNFFKHADKDPTKVLDFKPDHSEILLLNCIDLHRRIGNQRSPVMLVFWHYFAIHHPWYFLSDPKQMPPGFRDFRKLSKTQFFDERIPVCQ